MENQHLSTTTFIMEVSQSNANAKTSGQMYAEKQDICRRPLKWSKLTLPMINWHRAPPDTMQKGRLSLLWHFCQKCITSIQSHKPMLRDILQNDWLAFFQSAMVIKGKERLRTCPRLEEAWATRQLNTLWAPGLKKDISGTIGQRGIKSVGWLIAFCGC